MTPARPWPRNGPTYVIRWDQVGGRFAYRFYFTRYWAERRVEFLQDLGFDVELYVTNTYWHRVGGGDQ